MMGHPTLGPGGNSFGNGGGSSPFGPAVLPNSNQLVTDWFVAPVTGSNANTGLTAGSPLRSIAEFRRRVWGARYGSPGFPTIVTIHALETSTNPDDGLFYGFVTIGTASNIVVLGIPSVLFSGTVTGYAPYAGNTRATLTDAAIPVSWTASAGISSAAGSRYIRRVGAAAQAALLLDIGARTAMIGLPTNTSETVVGVPSFALTNFVVGDAYQVVTRLQWPALESDNLVKVRLQCLDVNLPAGIGSIPVVLRNEYVLCGYLSTFNVAVGGIEVSYNCVFMGGVNDGSGRFIPIMSSFKSMVYQVGGNININGQENVALTSEMRIWNGGNWASSGTWHMFDTAFPLINLIRGSRADLSGGGIVGSNNTGPLVQVTSGSYVTFGSLVTATTSVALAYTVAGVAYLSPTVDDSAGTGIYL